MRKLIVVISALAITCFSGCSKGQTGGGNNALDAHCAVVCATQE